jgi:hypothetical protein
MNFAMQSPGGPAGRPVWAASLARVCNFMSALTGISQTVTARGVRGSCAIAILVAALAACSDVTSIDAAGTREFRGRYGSGFEASAFLACEQPDGASAWWAEFALEERSVPLDSAFAAARNVSEPWRGPEMYVEVRGRLSEPGAYGHLSAWKRQLTILAVRRVAAWSPTACARP